MNTTPQKLKGIGGWLHLFAIHILISIFGNFMGMLKYAGLLERQNVGRGWLTFQLWESRLLFVAFLIVAVLLFTKNKLFPKAYAATCIALGVLTFIGGQESAKQFNLDPFQQIIFYVLTVGVTYATVMYLFRSERVKNTFLS